MITDMELREITNSDRTFFAQLFSVDAPENRFIDFYRKTDDWLKLTDNEKRFALVAVVHGSLVGFADIELDGTGGSSFAFGIAPTLRGQGFGAKLLQAIEVFCKNQGATTIQAGVEKENIACISLLQKNGYTTTTIEEDVINFRKTL